MREGRGPRAFGGAAPLLGVALAACVWACTTAWGAGPASATPRAAGPATAGLEQSWATAAGTWAVVAMGHLDQPSNTFWQVLFRPVGTARWTLVTPPGVASNGGFSADGVPSGTGGPGVVTAGFQASENLTYSPIARTSDDGKKWSAGILPAALSPVADGVAGGTAGEVFALVRSKGGTLLRSRGSLTAWEPLVTRHALEATAAGRRCGPDALTAVADAGGAAASPELGAACASTGVVGLFHRSSGRWVLTPVRVRDGARSTFTVLRLESGASGTSALLEARRAGRASLVVLWRTAPSGSWTASSPVDLDGAVLSTTSMGTSLVVVTGRGFHAQDVLWIGGPGTGWRSLGAPPSGTAVVTRAPRAVTSSGATARAGGPGGLSALSVSGSTVDVWRRTGDGPWRRTTQRFDVPIEYGSST